MVHFDILLTIMFFLVEFILYKFQLFKGNEDRNSEVKHVLFDGIFAKYLRFLPKTHHNSVCMRTEVFGVKRKPGKK